MKLLLVGAFPYPFGQGSQVYFQEQARALREAGASVELMSYASGEAAAEDTARALGGFVHHTPAAWTAPQRLRSGPALGKPLADWALARALRRTVETPSATAPYDAVLTHNTEAALAASRGLRASPLPQIYCVHTLLGNELSTYLPAGSSISEKRKAGLWAQRKMARGLDGAGRQIDRFLARRVDGWITLTHSSRRVMRQFSNRPGALIPPPVPAASGGRADPEVIAFTEQLGLEAGEYFLYSGNLDGYQELPVLFEAAARLVDRLAKSQQRQRPIPRIVIASHDPKAAAHLGNRPGLEVCCVRSSREMLLLLRGARANLVMRRAAGGYPIKLANAHAQGTPSIVFQDRDWGLTDGKNCLAADLGTPAESLAEAIEQLAGDAALAERLGAGARALHREEHAPKIAAERTLALIEQVIAAPI